MKIYIWIAVAFAAVYYFRRYWLAPWATYVRHTETKTGGVFMTVRRVHWYPPFLGWEQTWHRADGCWWVDERTGYPARREHDFGGGDRQAQLSNMLNAVKARAAETEELLRESK